MKDSILVHSTAVAAVPLHGAHVWRSEVLERVGRGERSLALFGRREAGDVLVTAVLRELAGGVAVLRTRVPCDAGYPSLAALVPALSVFEREIHEQTGMPLPGHPWLKPLRSPAGGPPMCAYPYYRIEGKEVHEVAVGPVHAGVIEPGSFRFQCMGEQVHHLEIQLGYQHRGVEARLLERPATRLAPLVETIAGDSSVAHAWAYAAAIESLAGWTVPAEEDWARAVMLELERIGMHLAGLAGVAADIGFLQGASTYGRLRTTAINAQMRLCGSRFGRGAVRPGGGGVRSGPEALADLAAAVALLQRDMLVIDRCFRSAHTVVDRLRGTGVLGLTDALELGIVGLAARASGVAIDARSQAAGGIYRELPMPLVLGDHGDCWARTALRIEEVAASLAWIAAAAERCRSHGGTSMNAPNLIGCGRRPVMLAAGQLVVTLVEGWRGEVVHALETGEGGELVHYKVQDPSLRNWQGLALALRGNEILDFPICNKSFDLSYCGNDL